MKGGGVKSTDQFLSFYHESFWGCFFFTLGRHLVFNLKLLIGPSSFTVGLTFVP